MVCDWWLEKVKAFERKGREGCAKGAEEDGTGDRLAEMHGRGKALARLDGWGGRGFGGGALRGAPKQPAARGLAVRTADALVFAADMYGVQFDQLATLTGGERSARAAAARWRELGYAESGRLGPGPAWLWVTRAGLTACGVAVEEGPDSLTVVGLLGYLTWLDWRLTLIVLGVGPVVVGVVAVVVVSVVVVYRCEYDTP